jgi:phenylpropionate dioxygenase-like ring-hydroxylating dioxygenase large terminal subunit
MFVRNAWYVAGWDHELTREMRRRVILDEPVLLFRTTDGAPVALEDRCCHRQAPLSMGKLVGNVVHCPYHGLQFDTTGKCVKVPSQDLVPNNAKVRAYPVIEKNHWIWVWMGDPAKADPAKIEDFHWMDDPAWRFGGSYLHVDANYLLVVENLLDTTHLPFLHPNTLGTDTFARSEFDVKREGDRITVTRWVMNELPAPFHRQMGGFPPAVLRQARRRLGAGRRRRAPGRSLEGREHVQPERDHAGDREDRALLLRAGLQLQAGRAVGVQHVKNAGSYHLSRGHGDHQGAAAEHGLRPERGGGARAGQGVDGDARHRAAPDQRGTRPGARRLARNN